MVFILHTFYELEQRTFLFIRANGVVYDKMSAKFVM